MKNYAQTHRFAKSTSEMERDELSKAYGDILVAHAKLKRIRARLSGALATVFFAGFILGISLYSAFRLVALIFGQ